MKYMNLIFILLIHAYSFQLISVTEIIEVTYEDLKELNVTCPPYDTCSALEPGYYESLTANECNCNMFCARYGTCCVNSRYKDMPTPDTKPTCRRVGESDLGYLVVDQCPQGGDLKSVYEDLCRNEWDGQNDIMRLIPVTSLFTHVTYKNFFCFRCHEANDDFLFWNVKVEFERNQDCEKESRHIQLEYDEHNKSWGAPIGENGTIVPVSFPTFIPPTDIYFVPKMCRPDVIVKCSEQWKDDMVRAKCDSYMAMTVIEKENITKEYKNPHCALCNFEDLNDFVCRSTFVTVLKAPESTNFSFFYLLDINRSDGEKVGKIQRCDSNDIWDPNFRKCRTPVCALPGYVAKDGKCVPP